MTVPEGSTILEAAIKIGINIIQIAILCNMGKLECVHIEDTKSEITKVWEELNKLRKDVKKLNNEN